MSLQEIVAEWVDRNRGERFNLIVANRPFGGKIGEAPLTLTGIEIQGAILVIRFETTERLTITKPLGVTVPVNRNETNIFVVKQPVLPPVNPAC